MNDYVMLAAGSSARRPGRSFSCGARWGSRSGCGSRRGIVGATVAAFATSSPELAVGVSAALNGVPQIAFGDVLGAGRTSST